MQVHRNAKTTPHMRGLLVHRIAQEHWSPGDAAAAAGISVRTRAVRASRAPWRPNSPAMSSPSPRDPPVISTTRFFSEKPLRRFILDSFVKMTPGPVDVPERAVSVRLSVIVSAVFHITRRSGCAHVFYCVTLNVLMLSHSLVRGLWRTHGTSRSK